MEFLHWRTPLLDAFGADARGHDNPVHKAFCRTLYLDQVPSVWNNSDRWVRACFHVFSFLLRERLPYLPVDEGFQQYILEYGSIDVD